MEEKHKDKHRENITHLRYGILLNGLFTIIEFVVGLLANSLALMSDALHDLADTLALLLSWFAAKKAEEAPTEKMTWGYHRATILAAFINGIALVLLTMFIFYRAYLRILNPEPVKGTFVFGLAVIGIMFNGAILFRLWRAKNIDLNLRSISWHIGEDVLGWIGVLIAGIVILLTDYYIIDPIMSILIGLIALKGAWGIIKEAVNILLEGVPKEIVLEDVEREIKKMKEVRDMHDLHVWHMGSSYNVLSAHIIVKDMRICDTNGIIKNINKMLEKKFGINHTTFAFESKECGYKNGRH